VLHDDRKVQHEWKAAWAKVGENSADLGEQIDVRFDHLKTLIVWMYKQQQRPAAAVSSDSVHRMGKTRCKASRRPCIVLSSA
jgi:hypothetical protein